MNEADAKAIAPKVNINGTSYDELYEHYMNALTQLDCAIDKVRNMLPHPRDYIPQSANNINFKDACDAHEQRCRKLLDVREEIYTILCAFAR